MSIIVKKGRSGLPPDTASTEYWATCCTVFNSTWFHVTVGGAHFHCSSPVVKEDDRIEEGAGCDFCLPRHGLNSLETKTSNFRERGAEILAQS